MAEEEKGGMKRRWPVLILSWFACFSVGVAIGMALGASAVGGMVGATIGFIVIVGILLSSAEERPGEFRWLRVTKFGALSLAIAIGSGAVNALQYQRQTILEKEANRTVYNQLIGLYNDIDVTAYHYYYERQVPLLEADNPYDTVEALRENFLEFILQARSDMYILREHLVATLKTLDPDEERMFRAWEFGSTPKLKELRRRVRELEEEAKLNKQIEELKRQESERTSDK